MVARKETTAELAVFLLPFTGRPVLDQTGLTDEYDFTLEFTPQNARPVSILRQPTPEHQSATDAAMIGQPGMTIFQAVQEQLGLKLEAGKAPIDVLVFDHLDKTPTEN